MKVCLKHKKNSFSEQEIKVIQNFISFLQLQTPLTKDITVHFTPERNKLMTTGVRMPGSNIYVLSDGRLLIDVLRTLSHEWVHEFQHQKLGVKDFSKTQDIGGPSENMANILSGIFMKKFQKLKPKFMKLLYGE